VIQFLDAIQKNAKPERKSDLGLFNLLSSSFETMQNAIASMKLAAYRPDVVVEIPRSACLAYEFYRAGEMVEVGYQCTEQAMDSHHD
jgi:NTE family protein